MSIDKQTYYDIFWNAIVLPIPILNGHLVAAQFMSGFGEGFKTNLYDYAITYPLPNHDTDLANTG